MEATEEKPRRLLKVKFANGDQDLSVELNNLSDDAGTLFRKVREAKRWSESHHVRLIAGGRELFATDPVKNVTCDVLHCIVSDFKPKRGDERNRSSVDQPQTDWFDMVDPGLVLMWIFGLMLGLFWMLFFCCGDMFDNASVAMLAVMTVAFVIPCAASHCPWPQSWQVNVSSSSVDTPVSFSSSISYGNTTAQRRTPSTYIPPRPHAPVRGSGT
ncbi:hypothetical protein BSKO_08345 [Bryopsis sp. KO-2023]|nr:hypothetical protein BSKO_08345 [Bryopsis sp. KO-2023]